MLSHTKKLGFIFMVFIIPFYSFSQNKQNRYYNPFRTSFSIIGKFPIPESNYPFDLVGGVAGEITYTIDNNAKYEVSLESGLLYGTSYDDVRDFNSIIVPVGLNFFYYFIDDTTSPFIGLGYFIENFKGESSKVLKPTVGFSFEKIKAFARFSLLNSYNSIELGVSISFKERPCGCFPQSK